MERYPDLPIDGGESYGNAAAEEQAEIAYYAGRGEVLMELEKANSSDHWGDKIVSAADRLRSRDLWEPQTDEGER